jgi:hypothetical protein
MRFDITKTKNRTESNTKSAKPFFYKENLTVDDLNTNKLSEKKYVNLLVSDATQFSPDSSFQIYQDKTSRQNNNNCSFIHKRDLEIENSESKKYLARIYKESNKYSGLRVISDTILSKRSFSNDNEVPPQNLKHNSGNKINLQLKKDKRIDYNNKNSLVRKALTTISYIKHLAPNFKPKGKDTNSIHDNVLFDVDNKENANPIFELSKYSETTAPTEFLTSFETPNSNNALVFSPDYYWQLIITRKLLGTTICIEDYHMLLYDYEQLWEHIQQLKEPYLKPVLVEGHVTDFKTG